MPKFGDLGSRCLKTNVRFEISTFEIEYKQSLVKINKLIHFGPECPNVGVWAQNFRERISDLGSALSK